MYITKEKIEAVKRSNDLVTVIQSKGIKLRRKGSNYVGLCPFHKEKTPSFTINPKTNLYHCFGCNAGGDVIGFVSKKEGIGFREAYERLNGAQQSSSAVAQQQNGKNKGNGKIKNTTSAKSTVNHTKLLNRVVSFYHKSFCEDRRALEYLQGRGITDKNIFTDFKIGCSNGTLLNTIPDDGDIHDTLKEIGILNNKGNEMFYGSVVFPVFDENKDCIGLYGRKIEDGEINHLYLPGPRKGVFNHQAAKRSRSLILTESIIDALTLYNAGFKDTIPCYGVNGLTEDHLSLFVRSQTKVDTTRFREVYICFDADEAGEQAAERIAGELKEKGIKPYIVNLPVSPESSNKTDINSFFLLTADAVSIFERLLKEANPSLAAKLKEAAKKEKDTYHKTQHGFTVTYGSRQYEIIGISRTETKLKVTIKGITPLNPPLDKGGSKGGLRRQFHLDTVDLYSARSRQLLTGSLTDLFAEDQGVITEDINRIMELIENQTETEKQTDDDKPKEEMTETEKQEAMRFLKNPDMFDEIIKDIETLGYTGDDTNKLLCFISAISRKLDEPLSVMIQSRSAAGKSFLQDTVLSLIPETDYVKYTRLTDQSLFYKDKHSLTHKILAIEELDGMNGAIYSIRSIQSSKKITVAYTGKDPVTGAMKTEENTVEGPVMVFITTTQVDIDGETASRFIFISLDESREMTERILEKQREKHTMEGLINKLKAKKIINKHHAVNRLLRPLFVLNPYCRLLTFTSRSLRARREQTKYLNLILAIAYIFQYQRETESMNYDNKEVEYIRVKIADIEKANTIAREVLGISLDELSPPSRRLLMLIREMVTEKSKEKNITPRQYHFTRRQIREYTDWSDFQIRIHIRELEDLEYIYSTTGRRGKEYVYELVYTEEIKENSRLLLGQIDIEELKTKAKEAGLPVD